MRTLPTLILAGLIGFAAGCGKKAEPAGSGGDGGAGPTADADLGAVQGQWIVTSLDVEFPADEPAEKHQKERDVVEKLMKSMEISVKDKLVTGKMELQKEPGYATFTLDAAKSPREVDFTESDAQGQPKPSREFEGFDTKTQKAKFKEGPAKTRRAIYRLEGDTLTIAFGTGKDAPRPTEFKAIPPKDAKTDDGGVVVVHLKKK